MKKKYKVVGFLAREHGFNGLVSLVNSDIYTPICVLTHKLKAKSQDSNRAVREDYSEYESLCRTNNIPLYAIDSKKDAMKIDEILMELKEFDLFASISWRRLIPANQLIMPTIGGVNLHRGKLPDYAGAEPIKQALNNGDRFVYITSHILAEEIDCGETIATYKHSVNYSNNESLYENIERLKDEITPHFGPLLIKSLNLMVEKYENR
jgi:methionyl-tRNA formyltransferase